ncbi:MAG: hypothetical protein CM15mP102_15370 [Flavobacteriales bacterium]|nr:MAG: hypothetical protein CM15mP102_15370 [Flavobacteriales bacterium]
MTCRYLFLTIFAASDEKISLFLLLLFFDNVYCQNEFNLIKSEETIISLDGVLSNDEKNNSIIVPIEYEQEPGIMFLKT